MLRSRKTFDVHEDSYGQSLPFRFDLLLAGLNAIGTIWIIGLMVIINSDVIGREMFQHPIRGTTEIISISIVGIVFLQLGDTIASGRMTRADILLGSLKEHRPWLSALLQGIYHAVGVLVVGVMLIASWNPTMNSIKIDEYLGALGDFTAPVWPVRIIMLIGMAAAVIAYAMLSILDFRRARLLRRLQK